MELGVLVLRLCDLVELGLGTLGLLRHGDRVSSRVDADGEGSPICSSRECVRFDISLHAGLGGLLACYFWRLKCRNDLTVLIGNFQNDSISASERCLLTECCLNAQICNFLWFRSSLRYVEQYRGRERHSLRDLQPRLSRFLKFQP